MQRVKNVQYEDDDVYDEDEDYAEEEAEAGESYSAEDRENFATLTPVVRAELEEAGVQASDREIEEALWHYYWDVGKTVTYLKNNKTPKARHAKKEEAKPKSKFDQAAEKSAKEAEPAVVPLMDAKTWFRDLSWTTVSPAIRGHLTPANTATIKLLGGSSKLAKLAEERRKKAALTAGEAPASVSSLDRLTRPKDSTKENHAPVPEPRKTYPIRKKREDTPPREKSPPPPEPEQTERLPDLRASPTEFGRTLSTGLQHGSSATHMPLKHLLRSEQAEDPFKGPSPDDTVLRAQQRSNLANVKPKQAVNGLAKKTEQLKLDQPAQLVQSKIRSKGLDVPKLWAEEIGRKQSAAFVVIGHVDHGKSTLMGRMLLDTGAVPQRDIDRYQKQATELGKSSFALAWVMDTGTEERERGVTVDIAQHHFSTEDVDFTILDAPGHRDFVPNMIGGASMADLAVLVVDVNQLESGMKGQTREHILLAKAVGLQKIVVAVNKLDSTTPPWDQDTFKDVESEVRKFLKDASFYEDNVIVVPCSGLGGENVAKASTSNNAASWIQSHPTLSQALERSEPSRSAEDMITHPLRMQIADVFRGGIVNPLSIAGRIRSGNVQTGDVVTVQPGGESATIKGIDVNDQSKDYAVAGQICTLHLADIEAQHLRTGDVLCSSPHPVPVVHTFLAVVEALDSLLPQSVDLHIGRLHVPASLSQLVATLSKEDEVLRRKPRIVKGGQRARVKLTVEGVPVERGERVVLRSGGSTVAYGFVE